VKGSSRSKERVTLLKQSRIKPHQLDISEKKGNLPDFLRSETLILTLASKDIEGFKYLISHIEKSTVKNVLFISSTSVYDAQQSPISEHCDTNNTLLSSIEQLFLENQHFNTTILRFGGLIGPKRNPGNFFKKGRSVKAPDSVVNLIHLDDCIQIIHQIILQKKWNTVLNACTDSHPTKREFYSKMMILTHQTTPYFDNESENTVKIISNKKLKKQLNYSFVHKDLMQLTLDNF